MIPKELLTKIKLIGVESGVIEIEYCETCILIAFYDEDTGVFANLYSIELGKFSFIKESYVIGDFVLSRIKNSEDAKAAQKILMDKGNKRNSELVTKAKEFAEEISQLAGIPVKVIPTLIGTPSVSTEFDNNMRHASLVFNGLDDDY